MNNHFDFIYNGVTYRLNYLLDKYGAAWFLADELADYLGYRTDNMFRMCNHYDVIHLTISHPTVPDLEIDASEFAYLFCGLPKHGGRRQFTIVRETGVYYIAMNARSRRPEVQQFKNWMLYTVLPSLKMYGAYVKSEMSNQPLQPFTRFRRSNAGFPDDYLALNRLAKMLFNDRYTNSSKDELMALMRADNYLKADNTPSQYSLNSGLMVLTRNSNGRLIPKITPTGEAYFLKIYSDIVRNNIIGIYIFVRENQKVAKKCSMDNAIELIEHLMRMYGPFNDETTNIYKRQLEMAGYKLNTNPMLKEDVV